MVSIELLSKSLKYLTFHKILNGGAYSKHFYIKHNFSHSLVIFCKAALKQYVN